MTFLFIWFWGLVAQVMLIAGLAFFIPEPTLRARLANAGGAVFELAIILLSWPVVLAAASTIGLARFFDYAFGAHHQS